MPTTKQKIEPKRTKGWRLDFNKMTYGVDVRTSVLDHLTRDAAVSFIREVAQEYFEEVYGKKVPYTDVIQELLVHDSISVSVQIIVQPWLGE